jgi:ubiquinone/menaquinone biosynthesis C-methylase UbiE
MPENWNQEKLLELSGAFSISRILLTAAELDLFTKLESTPSGVDDLCSHEGWDPRGTRILMDALASQGLLARSADGEYRVPQHLTGLLSADSEESVLPMILHRGFMWKNWTNLTEIVQTGHNPNPMGADSRTDKEIRSFIGAMHVVGRRMADTIAKSLDLTGFSNMLDVGGGPGTYVMAFLREAPHLSATLFDLPQVVEIARPRLESAGLLDRVNLVRGDFKVDELPAGHDLLLLSAIIHMNSREGNRDLYKKAYRSLEPGGTILIRDHFLEQSRTAPADGAIFAVNMLTATKRGDSYTVDETREDLEAAEFREVRMIRDGTAMDQLITAIKK